MDDEVSDSAIIASSLIKTNAFLMQGSKNTVKLMVSATLVGGQRKKHNKTNGFCIAPQQQVLKRYKNQWFFNDFNC